MVGFRVGGLKAAVETLICKTQYQMCPLPFGPLPLGAPLMKAQAP